MLVQPKFKTNKIAKLPKLIGLFLFNNCSYHQDKCTFPFPSFPFPSFKLTNKKTVS